MGELIINGSAVELDVDVRHDHVYEPGTCGVSERLKPPDLGVLHWTGGEGPGPRVFEVLRRRRLSIHFVIDAEGVIWQCCDPGLYRCAHAGPRANDRSVGIEVVCYGHGRASLNSARERYEARIHGWLTTWADFLPSQYEALGVLCDALSEGLCIPRRVPSEPAQRLSAAELDEYSGWLGHLHVERLEKPHPKCDPGTRPFEYLRERWSL